MLQRTTAFLGAPHKIALMFHSLHSCMLWMQCGCLHYQQCFHPVLVGHWSIYTCTNYIAIPNLWSWLATYPIPLQGVLIILVHKTLSTLLKIVNRRISPPFDAITKFVILLTYIHTACSSKWIPSYYQAVKLTLHCVNHPPTIAGILNYVPTNYHFVVTMATNTENFI